MTVQHSNYFDFLRIMGSLLVILSHCATYYMIDSVGQEIAFFSELNGIMFLKIITRVNVPLFFMMSGALLLNPDYKFKLRHNLPRIVWPLLFWSIFTSLIIGNLMLNLNLKESFIQPFFAYGSYNLHLWYLYTLVGFYIVMPVLKKIVNALDKKDLFYLLVIWFTFSISIPFLANYFDTLKAIAYKPDFLAGDMGFLFLGYYLHNYVNLTKKKHIVLSFVFLLILYIVNLSLHWHYHFDADKLNKTFIHRKSLLVVLQSILFFLLAKACLNKPNKLFTFLTNYSFVAYCCHYLVLKFLFSVPVTKSLLAHYREISQLGSLIGIFLLLVLLSYSISLCVSLLPAKIAYYLGANKKSLKSCTVRK